MSAEAKVKTGICSWCIDRVTDYILNGTAPAIPELKVEEEVEEYEVCARCVPIAVKAGMKWAATFTFTPVQRYVEDRKRISIHYRKEAEIRGIEGMQQWDRLHRQIHPDEFMDEDKEKVH